VTTPMRVKDTRQRPSERSTHVRDTICDRRGWLPGHGWHLFQVVRQRLGKRADVTALRRIGGRADSHAHRLISPGATVRIASQHRPFWRRPVGVHFAAAKQRLWLAHAALVLTGGPVAIAFNTGTDRSSSSKSIRDTASAKPSGGVSQERSQLHWDEHCAGVVWENAVAIVRSCPAPRAKLPAEKDRNCSWSAGRTV